MNAITRKKQDTLAHTPDRKPPELSLEKVEANVLSVGVSGDISRIEKASGNAQVTNGLLHQVANVGSYRQAVDENASNFVLGFVDSMQPRDAAEALLFTQMAAIHQATMALSKRMNHVETIPQQDAAERALNKLARTYAGQMDTLKRYRSKGQQVVRVERVTIENGAQAVVGDVHHGGRGHV